MAELCESMIRIAHDCQASDRPVSFPEKILPTALPSLREPNALPTGASAFDRETRFPDSLKTPGLSPQVDALLAENRRQLAVLQRRVAVLERELERAAEGFRTIANHPILGPLLKVRQTAIRFGNQISHVLSRDSEEPGPDDKEPVPAPQETTQDER
jgi:hypothetical protein